MKPDPFPATDAELFTYISSRANERPAVPWEEIAEELGVAVQDLLNWFLAYRQPKRDRHQLARKGSMPMLLATNPSGGQYTLSRDAQRFANWRRASVGAAAARRG
jgi:hypothetical protein